jgi:hypothetical protein
MVQVVMSYDDLRNLLQLARLQVQAFNAGTDATYAEESLDVSRGPDTMRFYPLGSDLDLTGTPDEATYVRYQYRNFRAPLSEIEIRLSDYRRSISVSGQPQEVHSAWMVLSTSLREYETVFRGHRWRFALYIPILLVGGLLAVIGAQNEDPVKPRWLRHAMYFSGLGLIFAWMLVPDGFLSGTLIVSGSTSFVNRHASAITLSGLVLSVLSLIPLLGWVRRRIRGSAPSSAPPAPQAAGS